MVEVVQTVTEVASETQIRRHNYLERAVLIVNGSEYFEWETISIMHAIDENPAFSFRFTCSEQTPFAEDWAFLRIRPGDQCTVFLDGYLAMSGYVITRQVFFNDTQHTVEIQGATSEIKLANAAMQSQTGEFKKIPLIGIAHKAADPYGVPVSTIGPISAEPFTNAAVQPGETAHAFVKRYSRQRNVRLTSNIRGHLVLIGGPIMSEDFVIEGNNILEGREVIHSLKGPSGFSTAGQRPGTDTSWGAEANQVMNAATFSGLGSMMSLGNLPQRILSEIPAWSEGQLKSRGGLENNVSDENQITVTARVLGWQKPTRGLWQVGELVTVTSPMLIMDGKRLTAKRVTFEQDDQNGTTTLLELMNAAALGGYATQ